MRLLQRNCWQVSRRAGSLDVKSACIDVRIYNDWYGLDHAMSSKRFHDMLEKCRNGVVWYSSQHSVS